MVKVFNIIRIILFMMVNDTTTKKNVRTFYITNLDSNTMANYFYFVCLCHLIKLQNSKKYKYRNFAW